MHIRSLLGGAIGAAGIVGVAVSAMLIDPYISDHIPKTPDAIHTIVWIHKGQLLGYVTPAEERYTRTALWLFLAMAFVWAMVVAPWKRDDGSEAFETLDARNWGYLAGGTLMLPVMIGIYLLLQH